MIPIEEYERAQRILRDWHQQNLQRAAASAKLPWGEEERQRRANNQRTREAFEDAKFPSPY